MKLKRVKTYQAIEFTLGDDSNFTRKNLVTMFDKVDVRNFPNLEMEILPNVGMIRIKTSTDDRLVSLANVAYAVAEDNKNTSEELKETKKTTQSRAKISSDI
jgi:hypothetical protein